MSIFKRGSLVVAEKVTIENWRKNVIGSQIKQDPAEIDTQAKFDLDEGFIYVRARTVSAGEYHGPNGNGDYFPEEELKKSYMTFIRRGVYLDHNSDSVDKACGIILDSKYWETEGTHYVECLLAIDKAHPIANKVVNGVANSTSMGAIVDECVCNVCTKTATNESEYCEHLRSYMGKVYNGRKVYAINKGVNFYEDSIVGTPADKDAQVLEVIASAKGNEFDKMIKLADAYQEKVAAPPEPGAAPTPVTPVKEKGKKPDPNFDQVVTEIVQDETEKGIEKALVQKVRDALKKLPPEKLVQREVNDEEILQAVKLELAKKMKDTTSVAGALKQTINSALAEIDNDERISLGEGYSVMEVAKVAGQEIMQLLDRGRATGLYSVKHADGLSKEAIQKHYLEKFSINMTTKAEIEKESQKTNEESVMQGRLTIRYTPGETLEKSTFIARKGNLEAMTTAAALLNDETKKAIIAFEKKAQGKVEYGVGDYDSTGGKVDQKIEVGKEPTSPAQVVNKGVGSGKVESMPKEYDSTEGKVDVKMEVGKEPIQPSQVVSKYASLLNGKVAKLTEDKNGVIEAIVEGGSISRLAQLWKTHTSIIKAAVKKEAMIAGEMPVISREHVDAVDHDPRDLTKTTLARETPPPPAGTATAGSRGAEEIRYYSQMDKGNLSDQGPDGWARKVAALEKKAATLEANEKALATENKILRATLEKTKKAQEDEKKGVLITAIMSRLAETGALEADPNEVLQLKDEKGMEHADAVVKAASNARDRQLRELDSLDIIALERMKSVINKFSAKTETTELERQKSMDIPFVVSDQSAGESLEDKLSASW